MNGWINLYKPRGISSNNILSILKKILNQKKIGHAGTLDPLADGVLPVALGEATKLSSFCENSRKKYEFLTQFGKRTSTGDLEGEIISYTEEKIEEKDLEKIIPNFIGKIMQSPHKFSAIKINGKRAYKIAREGKDFEIPKREIEIYNLVLLEFSYEKQQARFQVECSKGTYVRSLAEDIAFCLQNLSFVLELRRLSVGQFEISNSLDIISLKNHDTAERLFEIITKNLYPVDIVLDDIPVINIDDNEEKIVRYGQSLFLKNTDVSSSIVLLKNNQKIVSIGKVFDGFFDIKRVFNL